MLKITNIWCEYAFVIIIKIHVFATNLFMSILKNIEYFGTLFDEENKVKDVGWRKRVMLNFIKCIEKSITARKIQKIFWLTIEIRWGKSLDIGMPGMRQL